MAVVTEYDPIASTGKVEGMCPNCKTKWELTLPLKNLVEYQKGAYVQDAFPNLDPDDRELLVSGICSSCFNKMFAEE